MSSRASLVVVYDVVSVRAGCGLALFPRVTSGTIGRSIPRGRLLFVLVSSRASRRPSLAAGFETVRWRAWNPRSGPAEVDARRLYVPAGYPSMFEYCVAELRLSEDAAYKRIQAARAARRFPVLFTALAEGRLHLAGVCLLASHLTPENTEERVAAAAHRPKPEIERLLAERCLRPELPAMTLAIPPLPN
jgi:hypothetical protein